MLALILVQKTLIWLIAVTNYDVTPDLVLIGLVYIGMKNGKTYGSITGFLSGLTIDFISFSFLGLMALSKSSAGFISGFFNDERKIARYLAGVGFILIVLLCSLVNNIIYFTIYFQGSTLKLSDIMMRYVIPTAIYTAIFAVLPVIFERRKRIR
ncbi:MAG TPA: rod shape-determining protein MreD [Ignavibacteria bacterium]|nr:rod shape-determining protein MreD [Ignavibacteria bacterium]